MCFASDSHKCSRRTMRDCGGGGGGATGVLSRTAARCQRGGGSARACASTWAGRPPASLVTTKTPHNARMIARVCFPYVLSCVSLSFKNRAFKFKLLNFSLILRTSTSGTKWKSISGSTSQNALHASSQRGRSLVDRAIWRATLFTRLCQWSAWT